MENGHRGLIGKSGWLLAAAVACIGTSALPAVAHAQVPSYRPVSTQVDQIAAAAGTYRLDVGAPKSRTIPLGDPGKFVAFPVKGVRYDVKAQVQSRAGAAVVRGTVELLDGEGNSLAKREATAQATPEGAGSLAIQAFATFLPKARSARITYEALSGADVYVADVSVSRLVAAEEIWEIDFGD